MHSASRHGGMVMLVLLLAAPRALAQQGAAPPAHCTARCGGPQCIAEAARCLLDAGHPRAALELLAPAEHPGHARLGLLLALTHWRLGDNVKARQVLLQLATHRPGECQVRSWLIWLHLQLAELDEAQVRLGAEGCPNSGPERTRWALFQAALERLRVDPDAAADAVAQALEQDQIFSGDEPLLREMRDYAFPLRPTPVSLRLDIGAGYTSNGMGADPSDPPSDLSATLTQSPAITIDALARLEPTWHSFINPRLEIGLRALVLTRGGEVSSPGASTYLDMSARPGVSLGPARLYYHGQLLLLRGGDPVSKGPVQVWPSESGPRWFIETHRGEAEVNPVPWMTLFAGAGRSIFRQAVRSRTEVDGGLGIHGQAWRLSLMGGVALRGHWAGDSEVQVTLPGGDARKVLISPYDLYGGTLFFSALLPLHYLDLRARLVLAFDTYTRSEGYFDNPPLNPDEDPTQVREDILVKAGLEVWSMAWRGLQAGASYGLTHHASNKDSLTFTDHRALGRVRFTFSFDPFGPGSVSGGEDHEPLPHQAGAMGQHEHLRIQDLIRQEDPVRRGTAGFY